MKKMEVASSTMQNMILLSSMTAVRMMKAAAVAVSMSLRAMERLAVCKARHIKVRLVYVLSRPNQRRKKQSVILVLLSLELCS